MNYPDSKSTLLIVLAITGIIFLTGCGQQAEKNSFNENVVSDYYQMKEQTGDTAVIFWDAATVAGSDSVECYELYYRTAEDLSWQPLIKNIAPSPKPEVTIFRDSLPANSTFFFFGVKYYTKSGSVSAIHTSTDSTTNPPGGWYMKWN